MVHFISNIKDYSLWLETTQITNNKIIKKKEFPALPYANIEKLKQEPKQQIPSGVLKKRVSISDKLINSDTT